MLGADCRWCSLADGGEDFVDCVFADGWFFCSDTGENPATPAR